MAGVAAVVPLLLVDDIPLPMTIALHLVMVSYSASGYSAFDDKTSKARAG